MKKSEQLWGGLLLAGVIVCGCGQKQMVQSQAPDGSAPIQSSARSKKSDHYVVKKHDTLWAIAGKTSIYGDSFEWPIIFKTNRDAIQDPDLIYPNQHFKIEKGADALEVKQAKKLGEETPKYIPHGKPNKNLPIDYF